MQRCGVISFPLVFFFSKSLALWYLIFYNVYILDHNTQFWGSFGYLVLLAEAEQLNTVTHMYQVIHTENIHIRKLSLTTCCVAVCKEGIYCYDKSPKTKTPCPQWKVKLSFLCKQLPFVITTDDNFNQTWSTDREIWSQCFEIIIIFFPFNTSGIVNGRLFTQIFK